MNKFQIYIQSKHYMTMPFRFKTLFNSCLLILPYFIFSIGITFYQRSFLQMFHFPLLVVSCHLVLKFLASIIFRGLYHAIIKVPIVQISWDSQVSKFAPIGISSGIDVGFSNWGLELVNVSLYTMTKSTAIIFVLVNALILRLEKASVALFFIVFSISGGLFLFTFKTTDFSTLGFILLLTASFASGFRWTLSQFVMQKADMGMKSPVDMMYFSQPWMFIAIFPISLFLEGNDFWNWWINNENLQCYQMVVRLLIGSCLAIGLEVSEYYAVYKTSSITLSVVGIIKEICILILAVEWNGDKMTTMKFLGLAMCMIGVIGHVWQKFSRSIENRYGIIDNEDNKHLTLPDSDSDSGDSNSSTEVLFDILNRRRS
ncbi:solute carrier family 35 member C2 isoform X2 [Acyrthosiphon pisum]|uniref:Sugar phosphate transporter domain-containing protein n=2 Tax=Acyrthosiphon pisum TaxID=7029 RepID=A0A8R1W4E6_ACYPI|nr:solute carrier family 35 member C2 isoform X2 [Acyrthosiphon pisum]|eukprot:XP_001944755.4 PREDICTED: solute carrier family 35 member C2 isoform X2 [Acyrthosiphon pisum]